jgi:mRNA interferase HicA
MKRTELIKTIKKGNCILIRHGSKHDWYQNPVTKISQPIPRHSEISDNLAKHIIRMLIEMPR